ncbi:aldehyde dehydrogenase family protein [Streptomyces sp. NPDC051018]|uniref:aldehyde dehydrogenase family protein n=1 Tax=Streptomyces sp. NPDC051018 TaxID=3365639 RepID=UPI0037AB1E6B
MSPAAVPLPEAHDDAGPGAEASRAADVNAATEVNRATDASQAAEVSRDPRTGAATAGPPATTPARLSAALAAAARDAEEFGATAPAVRAGRLAAVADALEEHAGELAALADAETALGPERLRGEVGRAAAQLRFYGSVAVEGSWLGVRIDGPDTTGSAELRRMNRPLGPVAVFGASNFPFAFGVAGHDTASALAAGCPVLVKAHPAHPLLSARLGDLVSGALRAAGAPEGAFALVTGFDAGLALVDAPEVAAVAFTGSQSGGTALVERAARRPVPVPVFAEMGTVNPVALTPAAAGVSDGTAAAAEGFTGSFTLGQGQFCTKPGLLLAPAGSGAADAVATALRKVAPGVLLTESIAAAYRQGVADLVAAGATPVASVPALTGGFAAEPTVLTVPARALRPGSRLLAECFGPVALVAEYGSVAELREVLAALQPSLAASVISAGPDDPDLPWLVEQLARRTGRVVVDGWPTGVATAWAQQHGGPWPATSRPEATSVGASALDRFTRPVAYQGVPQAALPMALRDGNPWGVVRRLDGAPEPAGAAAAGGRA